MSWSEERDVVSSISTVHPDLVMIELDEELKARDSNKVQCLDHSAWTSCF